MSDLSAPLDWEPPQDTLPLPLNPELRPGPPAPQPGPVRGQNTPAPAPAGAKTSQPPFAWPTPPYASYPVATPQTDPLPCEIVGINDKRMTGRLTFFVPDEGVAHVQLPPARTTLPLRFEQFRMLTLTTPLAPTLKSSGDPHALILGHRAHSIYQLTLAGGTELTGSTIGYVENEHGLFLFPPLDENEAKADGRVLRSFIPHGAYSTFEIGSRIGELLVEQNSTTPQQIDEAIDVQRELRDRRIGDILVTRQIVSPQQLFEAIERQARMPLVRIGEALLSLGMISEAQLQEALAQQQQDRSVPLGELLVRLKMVSREDLQIALARKMGYPLVDVDAFPIEADALRKLSYAVASRLAVVPLLVREGRLIVALDDPARRRSAVDEVEFSAQMKVVPVLAHSRSIETVLHAAYDKIGAISAIGGPRANAADAAIPLTFDLHDTDKLVETLEKEGLERAASHADDDRPIEQSDNSLVRLLNNMIIEAHNDRASDIHIESYPGREKIRIRFRKDGLLRTYLELPHNYRNALIARVKIMCDLDISERRKPQDGKINFAKFSPQHRLELRVATIPTNNGLEDVVMRILTSAKPLPLDRLGLSNENLERVKHAVERPYGMVLCVGPTGSGKTTTLHSALSHINVPERKIWTAEDPVEITQPGLRQVQVNPKIDWTFAKALRAFLRADPDVIMVGEIRDAETASMAVEASLTGHLVLSTLHTNSAPETVTRLLDMGLDPFNFGDSLLAVLAQRLVRRLCTECRKSRPAQQGDIDELLGDYMHAFGSGHGTPPPVSPDAVLERWRARNAGRDGQLQMHHSPGCKACDNTGYQGRAGLHELMVISRELRHQIQTGTRAEALARIAMAEGMRTLRHDGIDKVMAGVTSIDEVRATSNV
jgi:type II secretory ATPase GspE/PulE/Tfp pilus assembly ATPase PilB-like protein